MFRSAITTLSILLAITLSSVADAQLTVTTGQTATTLANAMAGGGVIIINPVLTCPSVANGTFSYTGGTLAINNGILLTTGHAASAAGPEPALESFVNGTAGDPDMAPYLPSTINTFDACILEFDVIPSGDTVTFNYQFGSEEYIQAVCSDFTDVFAFFISGPGIAGTQNMALVPGTNIPVEINTINNGTPGTVPSANISNCTSIGAGSPFTAYYTDNAGGTELSCRGYTTKLRAFHSVIACDTYHLKLSIVDAGNRLYDSDVFLEKGSLSSNSYKFSLNDSIGTTINGQQHTIVKGCNPATIKILADHASATPETIDLYYGGSAVEGLDVSTLPTSLILPPGNTSITFNIQGLATPVSGATTLNIYIRSACGYSDFITLNILDTPVIRILTPDTAICSGQSFIIRTSAPDGVTYNWSPAVGLSSTTAAEPVASPVVNTVYHLSAFYPNTGCPLSNTSFIVNMARVDLNILNGDSVFCTGTYYTFYAGLPQFNIYWSFGAGDTVKGLNSVVHAWGTAGVFNVVAGPLYTGCGAAVFKTIKVYPTPFIYLGADTIICPGGATILLHDVNNGTSPSANWLWSSGATTPYMTIGEPGQYYATVSDNGCTASDSIKIGPDCFAAIPNVFTPNSDGVNDYFFPRTVLSAGLTKFDMRIYNRWGQLIFETTSLDGTGWDGKFNGEMQPSGVFVYTVSATFKDGSSLQRQGNVTLLR